MSNSIISNLLENLKTDYTEFYFRKYHVINEATGKPFQTGESKLGVYSAARDVIYVKESMKGKTKFIIAFNTEGRMFVDGKNVTKIDIDLMLGYKKQEPKQEDLVTYSQLRDEGLAKNDTNFCSVIAVAVSLNINFEKASQLLANEGRRARKGVWPVQISRALRNGGASVEEVKLEKNFTVTTATKNLPRKGTFIAYVRGHVVAIRDGVVQDWTEGRRHRITSVFEVKTK